MNEQQTIDRLKEENKGLKARLTILKQEIIKLENKSHGQKNAISNLQGMKDWYETKLETKRKALEEYKQFETDRQAYFRHIIVTKSSIRWVLNTVINLLDEYIEKKTRQWSPHQQYKITRLAEQLKLVFYEFDNPKNTN